MADFKFDLSILEKAKNGDANALDSLTSCFSPVIRAISGSYFLYGGDSEDLYQIGLIAFYDAVKKFDLSKNTDFTRFAKVCIHSRIMDAIREANRKKHSPLNTAVGFENIDAVSSVDPEKLFLAREQLLTVYSQIEAKLSDYEKLVLNLYVDGLSYKEIARRVGKSVKSVDNAITRIRNKLI